MKNILVRRCQQAACLLATCSCMNLALADWSIDQSRRGYNQSYGDFPPEDIDKRIFGYQNTSRQQEQEQSQTQDINSDPAVLNNNQADLPATQNYPVYNYQQPNYGAYDRGGRYQQNTIPGNYQDMNFTGPWNNRGSGFSGPWNNNGSNFSGPWNNNGSNFSGPWNNNGSNFSMPWGNNNGSGFNPMGNGNSWGW